jgi:hypothetical protein
MEELLFYLPTQEVVQPSSCLLETIYFTLPLAGESGSQARRVCESSPGLQPDPPCKGG